ncbi:TonB-dependent siderophore receptor [Psychrobacter pygoscelis]|uniref:TonB-dependent siderophore receptor n=1 Tax=Psychrobacter pygoscelis TaxID=2488563 RepID=UPI001040BE33|nr:TonB-dependent siderophore receptor [Psychrobacter pygoscelis]
MQSRYFKYSPLIVAINTALFMAMPTHAAEVSTIANLDSLDNLDTIDSTDKESEDIPSVTLPAVVVTSNLATDITENTNAYTIPITSTATGLALSTKETPQSSSVITNQQIKDKQLNTLVDVLNNTPAIQVSKFDSTRQGFSARGFEINHFQVDGMNVNFIQQAAMSEYGANTAMYDHVEVVRGATGLMSGAGDPSANINLVRKHANSTVPSTEVSATANRFGNYGVSIDHSRALTQDGDIRGRVIASYSDGDTFIERENKGNTLAYVTIDADIGDNTTANIGAAYQHNKNHNVMWGGLPSYLSDGTHADWDVSKNDSPNWARWDSDVMQYFANINHNINDNWTVALKGSYQNATSSPKLYYHYGSTVDADTGIGPRPHVYFADTERTQTNLQGTLTGDFEAFGQPQQVIAGASYNNNDLESYDYQFDKEKLAPARNFFTWDGSYPEPAWGNTKQSSDATFRESAVFAAAKVSLAEPVSLILGSRLSNYTAKGTQFDTDVSTEAKNVVTPYAGVNYKLNDAHTLYANYSDIFKPQTQRDINGHYLDPITGKNYEIGLKSSNADGSLTSQVNIFKILQDNVAQADGDKKITGTTPPEQAYYGAKGTTSTGVEVEVTGKLSDNINSTLAYSHYHAKDNKNQPISTTIPNTNIQLFTSYDLSDKISGLTVGAGVNWLSEYHSFGTNPKTQQPEKYSQSPVTLVNAMARYAISDNLGIQVNVNNLLNKKYVVSNPWGLDQISYGEPINVMGKITYKW